MARLLRVTPGKDPALVGRMRRAHALVAGRAPDVVRGRVRIAQRLVREGSAMKVEELLLVLCYLGQAGKGLGHAPVAKIALKGPPACQPPKLRPLFFQPPQ